MVRALLLATVAGLSLALAGGAQACEEKLRVAVDIGHDARNQGALSARGIGEYAFNRRLSQELVAHLSSRPWIDAFLLEEQGRRISLEERRARAKARNADLLISVHHDSVQEQFLSTWQHNGRELRSSELFSGYSLFYSQESGRPTLSRQVASAIGRALRDANLSPTDHHSMDVEGERRALVEPEHGVYRVDKFGVLRASMAAVLLEAGVIVNRAEEERLNNPAYRMVLVKAIARALDGLRCELVADPG